MVPALAMAIGAGRRAQLEGAGDWLCRESRNPSAQNRHKTLSKDLGFGFRQEAYTL